MSERTVRLPATLRDRVRRLHPLLKRKVRGALTDLLRDPGCGKPLRRELEGYWSLRVGAHRLIYRPDEHGVELIAFGPRSTIYEETQMLTRQTPAPERRRE